MRIVTILNKANGQQTTAERSVNIERKKNMISLQVMFLIDD